MRKLLVICFLLTILCSCTNEKETVQVEIEVKENDSGQELGLSVEENSESDIENVYFNRISLNILEGWVYSVNPEAIEGTDQIKLYTNDVNKGIIQITVTNSRDDISLFDAVKQGGMAQAAQMTNYPEFEDCYVGGGREASELWGREGVVLSFELIRNSSEDSNEVVMEIYCLGEKLSETDEVIFISAFIIGDEEEEIEQIISSLEVLDIN